MVHNVPSVRANRPVLTLFPQSHTNRFGDGRELMHLINALRPDLWLVFEFLLLPSLAVVLIASGLVWAWALVGASLAFVLRRYGPHWWPGRR